MEIAVQTTGKFNDQQRETLASYLKRTFDCEVGLDRHHPSRKAGAVILAIRDIPSDYPGMGETGRSGAFGRICHRVNQYLGDAVKEVTAVDPTGRLRLYKAR